MDIVDWLDAEGTENAHIARDEIERMRSGVEQCYKMLLSEPNTKSALFKAEDILRELIAGFKK